MGRTSPAAAVWVLGGFGAFVAADVLVTRDAEDGRPAELTFVPFVEDVLASVVLTSGQRALLEQAPLAHLSGCRPQPTVESAAEVDRRRQLGRRAAVLLRQQPRPCGAVVGLW